MSDEPKFFNETIGTTIKDLYEGQHGTGSWPGPPDRTHLSDPVRVGEILKQLLA
ncbi:hypothetical protein GCM10022377_10030 [Zhihengliuella alba]|uniref:Uncharacterized protein n=1 Tax=Zhihengliuella alba TaxID=547018 RepID=A0ABP7D0E1_9MICC